MNDEPKLSPLMQQYQALRSALPDDTLLLYRLGDFYELFFDDAKAAAKILNVTLTKRNSVPMCGVPYHAADGYIQHLVRSGKRVAIAEQTGVPVHDRLTERKIVRVINPDVPAEEPLFPPQHCQHCGGQVWANTAAHHEKADCLK